MASAERALHRHAPSTSIRRWGTVARHRLRVALGNHESLLPLLLRLRSSPWEMEVSPRTEVVIEGFQRSANSFVDTAFKLANGWDTRVASHLHAPALVRWAVRHRIPTLLLVRSPRDVVPSYVQYFPFVTAKTALREYIDFHSRVLPVLDDVFVATFEQVTTDLGAVMQRFNERFGTSFLPFVHDERNVAACFEHLEKAQRVLTGDLEESQVARPSDVRRAEATAIRRQLSERRLGRLVERAETLYEQIASRAPE